MRKIWDWVSGPSPSLPISGATPSQPGGGGAWPWRGGRPCVTDPLVISLLLTDGSLISLVGGSYHFGLFCFVVCFAPLLIPYMFPLLGWTQWFGVSLYLRGFRGGYIVAANRALLCLLFCLIP
jgi:hypothetical protein